MWALSNTSGPVLRRLAGGFLASVLLVSCGSGLSSEEDYQAALAAAKETESGQSTSTDGTIEEPPSATPSDRAAMQPTPAAEAEIAALDRQAVEIEALQREEEGRRLAAQQAVQIALADYNASQAKYCISGNSYRHINDSIVKCGCGYNSYAHSRDGTTVCAGGLYNSYAHSRDGTRVCAGGLYNSYAHSRDGTSVACGGRFNSYARSRDGSMTCYGGLYRR